MRSFDADLKEIAPVLSARNPLQAHIPALEITIEINLGINEFLVFNIIAGIEPKLPNIGKRDSGRGIQQGCRGCRLKGFISA